MMESRASEASSECVQGRRKSLNADPLGSKKIDAEPTFSLFAELSLALAGFGGVASAFGGSGRQFAPAELTRLRALFFHASLSLATSLLGISLIWLGRSVPSVALWASALALSAQIPAASYFTLKAYRYAADPINSTTWPVFWAIVLPTWGAGGLYGTSLVSGGSMGLLALGLSVQLLLGVWVFVRVLTLRD
jgi:hypothetical protein